MIQEKILDLLKRKQGYVSGDQISERLEISRQALWQHIRDLQEAGYDIVAVPHLGYKFMAGPDRLSVFETSRGLDTRLFGKKVYYSDSVTSTMNVAMKLGREKAPEGTVIIAESQTQGRGRLGRSWFSPKHKGIYCSLILKPKIIPSGTPILTLLGAVSICAAIKKVTGLDVQIKWPNDLMLKGKKLGGLLTELSAKGGAVLFVVMGFGLNVNNDRKSLISGAVSLKGVKSEDINRVQLLQEILKAMESQYLLWQKGGNRVILEKWRQHNMTLGRRVKVYAKRAHIEGQALDVDADGGLLVRTDSGVIEKVMAGDVVLCR